MGHCFYSFIPNNILSQKEKTENSGGLLLKKKSIKQVCQKNFFFLNDRDFDLIDESALVIEISEYEYITSETTWKR